MNFEQLINNSANYWIKINKKKKKLLKKYLIYNFNLLKWKKNKLKLGLIFFEIRQIYISNLLIYESVEMIFIRQDNTFENELKIENRLKMLNWKWNFENISSFLLIFFFFFYKFFKIILFYFILIFSNLNLNYFFKIKILGIFFNFIYINFSFSLINIFYNYNFFLSNLLVNFSIYYDFFL